MDPQLGCLYPEERNYTNLTNYGFLSGTLGKKGLMEAEEY